WIHLGAFRLGPLVDLGRAFHFNVYLLADVRRLSDAAPRHRGIHAARAAFRRALDFRIRERRIRVQVDRVVPYAASLAGVKYPGRRRYGSGHGGADVLELAGPRLLGCRTGDYPHAP